MSRRRGGASAIRELEPPARRLAASRTRDEDVRATAVWVLERALAARAPLDLEREGALARFDERDRALLTELVLGTLRWLRRLDQVIAAASHRRLAEIEPVLRTVLRVGAYQLLFLDRVPAHAAVSEAVDLAQRLTHRGGASFVNAVLRRLARTPQLADWPVEESDPIRRLAIESSHPDFLVRRWSERFGLAATRQLLAANNEPKPLHLLAFRDRGGREPLAEELIDGGFEVEPSALAPLGLVVRSGGPWATEAYRRGDFYVQDEASQAAALVPPPRPGERIWDAAAAPGGKSFALLAQEPAVQIAASDASPPRLAQLLGNCRRLRRPLALAAADAARPPFGARFDRVLLDLPCSGTGTLRKHPELKWRLSEGEIGRLAAQALALLVGAAPAVAPGGLLIAITCSLEREENEEVFARFLAAQRDFSPLPLEGLLAGAAARAIAAPGLWRLATAGDHDGFTVQVAVREKAR